MFKIREKITNITPYVPGKPVKEVERELGIKNSIKLASNENAWGFSPKAKHAMDEAIKKANMYPDGGSFYLRKRIAEFEAVSMENIVAGNGSIEVLELIMRLGLDDKTNVVSSQYAFAMYRIITEACGAEYRPTKAKNHMFDIRAIVDGCDKNTAIIVVDNPNNPTGTYLPFDEMMQLMEFAKKNNILLISDEAYIEFVRAKDYKTMMSVFKEYESNLVITRTFSKAYGLGGIRVGYGIASREIIGTANKIREAFNVNVVAQDAATAALDDQDFVKETVKKTHEGIDYFKTELKKLGLNYLPTECSFVLIEVPEDGKIFFDKLLQRGIIVRPMQGYGLPRHIRLSVGTMEQNKKVIETIRSIAG
ncbi:MAG: histidinol-phosphate transaminase [Pseudomonadota bacterium]